MTTSFVAELLVRGAVLSVLGAGALLVHRARPRSGGMAWTVTAALILGLPLGMVVIPDLEILPSFEASQRGESAGEVPRTAAGETASMSTPHVGTGAPVADGVVSNHADGVPKLPLLWLLGAVVCLAPVVRSIAVEMRLRSDSGPVDPEIALLAAVCARSIGLRETPPILTSDRSPVAFAAGLFRPWVHVPRAIADGDPEALRGVLLHELAHVEERHWAARRLSDLALALHWPNPIVWWANRRLSLVQEFAADDRVISAGYRPAAYTEILLDAARRHLEGRHLSTMWAPTGLAGRVARILEVRPRSSTRGTASPFVLLAAAIVTAGATSEMPMADAHRHVRVRIALGNIRVEPQQEGRPVVDARIWRRDQAGVVREWGGAPGERVRIEQRGDTLFVDDVQFASDPGPGEAWKIDVTVRAGHVTSVDAESRNGDVDIRAGGRRLRAVSGTGDVSIELADREIGSLEAFVGEGAIAASLLGVTEAARASVGEGAVRLSLASRAPDRFLHVDGGEALVDLKLPAGASCRLEIDVGSGPIRIHPPDRVRRLPIPNGSPFDLVGTIGEGGGSCRLDLGEGEVDVRLG